MTPLRTPVQHYNNCNHGLQSPSVSLFQPYYGSVGVDAYVHCDLHVIPFLFTPSILRKLTEYFDEIYNCLTWLVELRLPLLYVRCCPCSNIKHKTIQSQIETYTRMKQRSYYACLFFCSPERFILNYFRGMDGLDPPPRVSRPILDVPTNIYTHTLNAKR